MPTSQDEEVRFAPDSSLEGDCVDALRGSRAFLASDLSGAALSHIGGKSPRRPAVILRIIRRAVPAPCGRRLGVSAKRSMSGHPRNVRESWAEDAKPDEMITGQESRTGAGCAT